MSMRLAVWGGIWVAGTAAAFLTLDPILATFLAVVGLCLWIVALLARDWDQHSTFEERELARARRRAEQWEKNADARARDKARWEANRQRKAGRSPR
ncbi:hypothetical protein [Geodermatophilus sp. CPCC 206100]|uniref:hypothetical protein n=1 Tax=Geodermatophilus sp. CPCC 206100 TaxID=3020054 RepID=UPI003B001B62